MLLDMTLHYLSALNHINDQWQIFMAILLERFSRLTAMQSVQPGAVYWSGAGDDEIVPVRPCKENCAP